MKKIAKNKITIYLDQFGVLSIYIYNENKVILDFVYSLFTLVKNKFTWYLTHGYLLISNTWVFFPYVVFGIHATLYVMG